MRRVYGVPPDLDLAPLVGSRVISVGLGLHNTLFVFEMRALDYGQINAEGLWELRDGDGVLGSRTREVLHLASLPFDRLLGATVTAFHVEPPSHCDLVLSTALTLRVYDDSEQYESFTVSPGDYVI
jgi:hypothetical protein